MNISIKTIPHKEQRYNTIGDWQWDGDTLNIKVSDMGDWRKEMLVARHELDEALLCKHKGITEQQVDEFDLGHPELHEPGDSCLAPYHVPHLIAIQTENILIEHLEVDEKEYLKVMEDLQMEYDKNATKL